MPLTHIGDLSRHFVFQTQSARVKASLIETSQEMTTGIAADKPKHLKGQIAGWASLERSISLLSNFEQTTNEAKTLAQSKQLILDNARSRSADLQELLLAANLGTSSLVYANNAGHAEDLLTSVIADFNTSVAGRTLFSGDATNTAALASATTMLTDIRANLGATTTVSNFLTVIDDWFFGAGGGFETVGYTGSTIDLSPIETRPGQSVNLAQRADSDAVRTTLRNIAIAALATDNSLGFSIADLQSLSLTAAEGLFSAQNLLTIEQSSLGFAQSLIDETLTEISSEISSHNILRNSLIGIDPYEAATELESLRIQMDTMYTLTARMSQLSLARYL